MTTTCQTRQNMIVELYTSILDDYETDHDALVTLIREGLATYSEDTRVLLRQMGNDLEAEREERKRLMISVMGLDEATFYAELKSGVSAELEAAESHEHFCRTYEFYHNHNYCNTTFDECKLCT